MLDVFCEFGVIMFCLSYGVFGEDECVVKKFVVEFVDLVEYSFCYF